MKKLRTMLGLGLLLTLANSAWAASEFVPIQERAQGQSLAGGSLLNDSLYSNPAASAFVQVYSIEGTYLPPRDFAVSVLDSQTSQITGAFGYFRQKKDENSAAFQGLKLALAGKISEMFAIGLAGKSLWGPDFTTGADASVKDMDLGLLANVGVFQIGLTTRNLLGGNEAFDLQREVVLGGRFGYEKMFFLSTALTTRTASVMSPYQLGVGAEYVSPYFFGLRAGYRQRFDTGETFWSAGASFLAPKLLVHYAVQFATETSDTMEHTVAAALLF